jgi:hypothetical protein
MDLFYVVYLVIEVIIIATVLGILFAASIGLEWYQRDRHTRTAQRLTKETVVKGGTSSSVRRA